MQQKEEHEESPQRLTALSRYIRAAIPDPVSPFDSSYEKQCSNLLDWLNAIHFNPNGSNPVDVEVLQSITQHHTSMTEYDLKRRNTLQKYGCKVFVGSGTADTTVGGEPDTTAMWKSSMMHSCLFGKTAGTHSRAEPLLLSDKDKLAPQQVLRDAKAHPQSYNVEELASFWAFIMRLDGLKKYQSVMLPIFTTVEDGEEEGCQPISLDRESSNIFIFRFPITKALLSSSLTSGRNTMLPLMKDPDFIKNLNKEFCTATDRGHCFNSASIAMEDVDIHPTCDSFMQDCNRPIYGVKEDDPAEKMALEGRGWSVEYGESSTDANSKQLDDWFNIMARGTKECILAVRKDIWFIWVSNWMVHNQSCAYPMYETMLKHWNLTTCGFLMVDRIRRYNVIRKMLSRINRGREFQTLNYVLSPDHVDFDSVYGPIFECLDMWNNSNAELQDALYESFEGAPTLDRSMLLGLESMLLIKKHHVIGGNALIDMHAFLTGQPVEGLPQYTLFDHKAISMRRDAIAEVLPYLFHMVETLKAANGQWNQLIRNASAVPSRNPMLIPLNNGGPPAGSKRKRKFGKPRPSSSTNETPSNTTIATTSALSVKDEMYFYDGTKHYVSTSYYGFGDCHFKQGRYRCDGDVFTKRRRIEAKSQMGISSMSDCSAESVAYKKAQRALNSKDMRKDPSAVYTTAYVAHVHNDNPPASYAPILAKHGEALEDILENCGRELTTSEKQYAHVWLDLGCLQEISLDASRKQGNRAMRQEFRRLQKLQRTTRMRKNREKNREYDIKCDDYCGEYDDAVDDDDQTTKVANIWHRHLRLPESPFYTQLQATIPVAMVAAEYLVTKTFFAVCTCPLFPIELRKRVFLSILLQRDNTVPRKGNTNKNTRSKGPSPNIVLVRDWNGASERPSKEDIAAMSPNITSNMRAGITKDYVNLGKADTVFSLYDHNSFTLSTKELNDNNVPLATHKFDPPKVHNRPSGGKEYVGYLTERKREGRAGMRDYIRALGDFDADEQFTNSDDNDDVTVIDDTTTTTTTTTQQHYSRLPPPPKEEWLWQDDVLFGGDDAKQRLVAKLAHDEKNSTVHDTTRKVMAFLEYAHNTNLRDKCLTGDNKKHRVPLHDMLLPYKPCYRGFQKSIVATKKEHQRLFQNYKALVLSPIPTPQLPIISKPPPTHLKPPAPPASFYITSFSANATNTKQRRGRKGNGSWLTSLSKKDAPQPIVVAPAAPAKRTLAVRCNRLTLAEKRTTCDDTFCLVFLTDYYCSTKEKKTRQKKVTSTTTTTTSTAAKTTTTIPTVTHAMSQRPHVVIEQHCMRLMTQKRCSSYFALPRSANGATHKQQQQHTEEEEDIVPAEPDFDTIYGKCSEPYNVQKLIEDIKDFERERIKWELIDAKIDNRFMEDRFDRVRKVLVMSRFR